MGTNIKDITNVIIAIILNTFDFLKIGTVKINNNTIIISNTIIKLGVLDILSKILLIL